MPPDSAKRCRLSSRRQRPSAAISTAAGYWRCSSMASDRRATGGSGDFTDLEGLIELAAGLGADGVGLNPLHALFDDRPADCSPYSPNSRLFLNPLYIDVEKLPEFQPRVSRAMARACAGCRASDIVDYAAVARAEMAGAALGFRQHSRPIRNAERHAGFRKISRRARAVAVALRLFRGAAAQIQASRGGNGRKQWRQPDDARCADLRAGPDAAEIEFVEFVQWAADQQLQSCRDLAATARHEGRPLSRRRRRRAIRRVRRLE